MQIVKLPSVNIKHFVFGLLVLGICSHALLALATDQVPGKLIITVEDYKAQKSVTRYFIEDQSRPGNTFEIHFATEPEDNLMTGMIVTGQGQLNGKHLENANIIKSNAAAFRKITPMSISSGSPVVTGMPVTTPVANLQTTLVYILQSPNQVNNFSNNQLYNIMFGKTGLSLSVNDFYYQNSFKSVTFDGTVVGPYTIDIPATCDSNSIRDQGDKAAIAAGINIANYTHHVYMMPNEMKSLCVFTGTSTLGGNPSISWIDTGYFSPNDPNIYVILEHELGHALNMQHAQSVQADGTLLEYGDNSCPMGDSAYNLVNFNVPHLIQEGWIPLSNVRQIRTNTVNAHVALAEASMSSEQALQIFLPGGNDILYVSYRQPDGQDSHLSSNFVTGASIHLWKGSNSKTRFVKTLTDGETYSVPGGLGGDAQSQEDAD